MDAISAAETSVLGVCFLADRSVVADISQRLDPDDFHQPQNKLLFTSIRSLINAGEEINSIAVIDHAESLGFSIGDDRGLSLDFVHKVEQSVASPISYESYISIVKQGSKRRFTQSSLVKAVTELSDPSCPIDETVDALVAALSRGTRADGLQVSTLSEAIAKAIKETQERFESDNEIVGIKTGLSELDDLTGGLKPQRMYILMGGTGRGKTCLALNIVNCAIRDGFKVLHLSLEMSGSDLAKRMMSMRSHVDGKRIDNGNLTSDELDQLLYAARGLRDDSGNLNFIEGRVSTSQLRMELIRMGDDQRPNLLVVDYLQLMVGESAPTRQQQIQKISSDLLSIAIEFDLCIIALSQQNKQGEARESKDIENDASGIMKIEYEDPAEGPAQPAPNVFINMTKHRFGDMGKARATFFRKHQLFVNRRDY